MNTIETLVDAHLAAYGEPDTAARRDAIRAVWNANGRLVDPPMESAGHAGIADQAATLLAQFPGHRFHRTTAVDLHHGFARYGWALRNPQGDTVLEGYLADPHHGGNHEQVAWKAIGFPEPPLRTPGGHGHHK